MEINILFKYAVDDYIPPRCRKPRREFFEAEANIEIREINAEHAPVALEYTQTIYVDGDRETRIFNMRWFEGKLWSRHPDPTRPQQLIMPEASYDERQSWNGRFTENYRSLEANIENLNAWASRHIIIGDELYQIAPEPAYYVSDNGPYIWINFYHRSWELQRTFRADDVDGALAYVKEHYNGKPAEFSQEIWVHIPEAIRFRPDIEWHEYMIKILGESAALQWEKIESLKQQIKTETERVWGLEGQLQHHLDSLAVAMED